MDFPEFLNGMAEPKRSNTHGDGLHFDISIIVELYDDFQRRWLFGACE
jgi:acid stress-induced BolA-like protein IbaG/YrbA